jgi:tetratricopeptide (TPR) repeat protein
VVADQESRDIVLTLFDPRGRQLLKIDSLIAPRPYPYPAEEIHWVADAPGRLRIELTLLDGARGPCNLRLVERRRATAADRQRALAEADLARGHALRRTRKPELCRAGIVSYESAQRQFTELGLPGRRAEALFGLGELQRDCLRDKEAALQAFTQAEPLFVGDRNSDAAVWQQLGEIRDLLGDLDGAIGEYRRALELRRRLGDRSDEALISSNLGHAFHLLGRYDEAAALLDRALALWQTSDDPDKRAGTLLNRGHLHHDLGENDRARERFSAALALFRQAKDPVNEAAALNALALLDLDAGRPAASLAPLQAALALRSPGSRGRAVTLTSLGVALRDLGRLEEARRAYAEALPIFRSLHDSREQARSLGDLGRLEVDTGQDAAALKDLDDALGLFQTLADRHQIAWILAGKAQVLRRHGELEAARGVMEEALAAIEHLRFSQISSTTRAEFFATQQSSYDFLIDLLMEQHRKAPTAGYDAAALEVGERSLARSLLDGLAASGTDLRRDRSGATGLHARERQVEAAIDILVSRQARLAQDPNAAALLRPVEAELGRRWDELDRVRTDLRTGDPRYAALTQPQPWKLAKIQRELLDRDTLLLEYRLGAERSFLWAVTPDSLKSFTLPGRAEI